MVPSGKTEVTEIALNTQTLAVCKEELFSQSDMLKEEWNLLLVRLTKGYYLTKQGCIVGIETLDSLNPKIFSILRCFPIYQTDDYLARYCQILY